MNATTNLRMLVQIAIDVDATRLKRSRRIYNWKSPGGDDFGVMGST